MDAVNSIIVVSFISSWCNSRMSNVSETERKWDENDVMIHEVKKIKPIQNVIFFWIYMSIVSIVCISEQLFPILCLSTVAGRYVHCVLLIFKYLNSSAYQSTFDKSDRKISLVYHVAKSFMKH